MNPAELSRRVAVEIMGWSTGLDPESRERGYFDANGKFTRVALDQIATDLNLAFEALWKVEPYAALTIMLQRNGLYYVGACFRHAEDTTLAAAVCSLALAIIEARR